MLKKGTSRKFAIKVFEGWNAKKFEMSLRVSKMSPANFLYFFTLVFNLLTTNVPII